MTENKPERLDLGHGVSITFTTWESHNPVGLVEYHNRPDGSPCVGGGILFDLPGVSEAFPDRPVWTLENLDPLTISPSLQCMSCSHHGFIRDGRWVPA